MPAAGVMARHIRRPAKRTAERDEALAHPQCTTPSRVCQEGQRELEHRAAFFLVGPGGKLAAMTFNNHAGNGQPKSHAVRLRCNERIKYTL